MWKKELVDPSPPPVKLPAKTDLIWDHGVGNTVGGVGGCDIHSCEKNALHAAFASSMHFLVGAGGESGRWKSLRISLQALSPPWRHT